MTYIIHIYIRKILNFLSKLVDPIINRNFVLKKIFSQYIWQLILFFQRTLKVIIWNLVFFKGDSFIEAYHACENAKKWNSKI